MDHSLFTVWLAPALALGLLTVTPGADTLLVIRATLSGGRAAALATACGVALGLFVHATLSGAGLAALLLASAGLYHTVRLAGAAYLIWLGVRSLREALRKPEVVGTTGVPGGANGAACAIPPLKALRQGFVCNVLNPKVALFYLAFLPQFMLPGESVLTRSLALATLHAVETLAWFSVLGLGLDSLRRHLLGPAFSRWLSGASGVLLAAIGVGVALAED